MFSPNSYVEILTPNVTVLGGEEGGVLTNGNNGPQRDLLRIFTVDYFFNLIFTCFIFFYLLSVRVFFGGGEGGCMISPLNFRVEKQCHWLFGISHFLFLFLLYTLKAVDLTLNSLWIITCGIFILMWNF